MLDSRSEAEQSEAPSSAAPVMRPLNSLNAYWSKRMKEPVVCWMAVDQVRRIPEGYSVLPGGLHVMRPICPNTLL